MTEQIIGLLGQGIWETLYMVLVSALFSYVIGIPLGVLVFVTDQNGICRNRVLNLLIGGVINFIRSIPFLILLVLILPFTRLIVGTTIGSTATIVPLVVAAAPYVARMVESSLKEVDSGVVEAAQAMGASRMQIILNVMLPEAKPSLLVGAAIVMTTILGYTAMAGMCGGGGLGAIAANYGYYRWQADVMIVATILLVVIVQIIQELWMRGAKASDKRIR